MVRRSPKTYMVRGWSSIRSAGRRRLAVSALLLVAAVLLARFSWEIPFTDSAERALFDFRTIYFAPLASQDKRILIVAYDDQTLIKARKRSPLDRGLLARALKNLDQMGAKAIGIDILFDQPQDEDDELVAALRGMKTPTFIGYTDMAANPNDIQYDQHVYLDSFLARLKGTRASPASIRLQSDGDGVTRVWPTPLPGEPPLLSRAMVKAGLDSRTSPPAYDGSIRYLYPRESNQPVFNELNIDLFADPDLAAAMASQVAGRYVLIGGDIVDTDRVQTPLSGYVDDSVRHKGRQLVPPGIEIHAAMIAQLLDGKLMPRPAPWVLWAEALLVVLAATLTGMLEMRSLTFIPLIAVQALLILGTPFYLQWRGVDTYMFPAVGPVLGWALAFAATVSAARASGAVQRRFAHSALGKYLPRSIAQEIIDKPELLALHGEKKEIFVLFSDLEGFTKMSHALEPEMVATLLNRYLEMLSQVVLDHGGVIDKFVGDAVVAFWGAPIAQPDDGERAAKAGFALWLAGEEFRAGIAPGLPPVGRTRVGLHFGEAVVGNFGGASRIQYTALGDSMNTAARLEAANKALETRVLASREFVERSGLDWWRPMGRIVLRGRARPVDVFEPVPEFPEADRRDLERAIELLDSDRPAALELLGEIVDRNPDDKALKNLLGRSRELNEEGSYVLG